MFSIFVCSLIDTWCIKKITVSIPGADPGFQVRGGALKKIAPSGGRRENCWGISCEKSRFYAKKSYYFQLRRKARKFFGYFVWKITILHQKIIFFPILGGARSGCAPPPWIRPCILWYRLIFSEQYDTTQVKVVFLETFVSWWYGILGIIPTAPHWYLDQHYRLCAKCSLIVFQ